MGRFHLLWAKNGQRFSFEHQFDRHHLPLWPQVLVQVFTTLLAEGSVVLFSDDPALLEALGAAFRGLLHPVEWYSLWISRLPPAMLSQRQLAQLLPIHAAAHAHTANSKSFRLPVFLGVPISAAAFRARFSRHKFLEQLRDAEDVLVLDLEGGGEAGGGRGGGTGGRGDGHVFWRRESREAKEGTYTIVYIFTFF